LGIDSKAIEVPGLLATGTLSAHTIAVAFGPQQIDITRPDPDVDELGDVSVVSASLGVAGVTP